MVDRLICPFVEPVVIDTEPGQYAWCQCGSTAVPPFCDGSHYGTGISPKMVIVNKKGKVKWCGCRQTKKPPYCDKSHEQIG